MKFLDKIFSYKEVLVSIIIFGYCLIKGISIVLSFLIAIAVGVVLFMMRRFSYKILSNSRENFRNITHQKNDYKETHNECNITKEQTEKTEEHHKKRPSESEIEKDLIRTLDTMKVFTHTKEDKFDLNHFACIQVMVNKYGFSQELIHAAKKVNPKLVEIIMYLYDMRVRESQSTGTTNTEVHSKFGFKRERVSPDDIKLVMEIVEKFGTDKKDFRYKEWIIDDKKENFLIKLQGDGYIDKKNVGVFVFGYKQCFVRIEAEYDIAGRAIDGCGVYWHIKKVQIPNEIKVEKDKILLNIREAFEAYGIGFDAMVQEFTLNFDCEPEFVEAVCGKEELKATQKTESKKEKEESVQGINIGDKAERIDLQRHYDEVKRLSKLSESDRTLEKIKGLGFEDAMFYITLHNSRMKQFGHSLEEMINPQQLFLNKSDEEIEDCILRSNRLLSSVFKASDYYLSYIRGKASFAEYQKCKEELISGNPGFSEEVYNKAIEVGLVAVR